MIIQLSVLLLILISGSESSITSSSRILGKHYHNFVSGNSNECFKTCLYDRNCKSATFQRNPLNCYLFNKTGDLVKDNFFISFFKNAIIPSLTIPSLRLFNHYQKIVGKSQSECLQFCLRDLICKASTYQISTKNCYLSDKDKQENDDGWVSFFTPELPSIKLNDPRFLNSIRLFNHSKKFKLPSQLECAQRCLLDEKCTAMTFDLSSNNCYFYDTIFQIMQKGWTSFFINFAGESYINFNSKFYQYYAIKIVETQSDCFALCIKENKCKASSFNLADRKCYLHESEKEQTKEPGWYGFIKKRRLE